MAKDKHCPICNLDSHTRYVNRGLTFTGGLALDILKCQSCSHHWMPTTDQQQAKIETGYGQSYVCFRTDEVFNQVVTKELENRLSVVAAPPCSLLDVGCGAGEFLLTASQSGYDCLGVDVSQDGVNIAKQKGLHAEAYDFLNHEFGRKFKVITMWDVMEHLKSPAAFLHRAASLLDDDGILVLKIPSFGNLNFHLLNYFPTRSGILLGAPDHIQYFTPHSLNKLLSRCGFEQAIWFQSKKFRSKPPNASLRRKISRFAQRVAGQLAGNRNLYLFATKQIINSALTQQLKPKRIVTLPHSVELKDS